MKTVFSRFNRTMRFGLIVLIAGCAAPGSEELKRQPNYDAGYADGCHTAQTHVEGFRKTVHRNENLFRDDEAYRLGWRAGYAACGEHRAQRPGQMMEGDMLAPEKY